MSGELPSEFEERLRRQSPAGPPADLRARVLARTSAAPQPAHGAEGRGSVGPWLTLAAAVIVVAAVVINAHIESSANGSGPVPAQPRLVTVPSPVPGAPPIVMIQPNRAPPVDMETFLKERAQVEALLKS